ncbi:unnamed protein product [Phaeothamnion confervicola]
MGGQAWELLKQIAFELKPFDLPTKEGCRRVAASAQKDAKFLWDEFNRVLPIFWAHVQSTAANVPPATAFRAALWLAGWVISSTVDIGVVYLILSAIWGVWVNLGDEGGSESGRSAYSVFNDGCRALMGSINARQFEREIMHQAPGAADEDDDAGEYVLVDLPGDGSANDGGGGGGGGGRGGGGNNNAARRRRAKKHGRTYEQRVLLREEAAAARALGNAFEDDN